MTESKSETVAKQPGGQKMLTEFGPLIVFFVAFKIWGIMAATAIFMVVMVLAMAFSWRTTGHISPMQKLTFVVVMVMGGLTLYLDDDRFVKMKMTIINGFFGLLLLFGYVRGKSYLQVVMEMALDMTDKGWMIMTRNYAIFLLAMAGVNEYIWRTQTTDFWVNFKTFGYMGVVFILTIAQIMWLSSKGYVTLPDDAAGSDETTGEDKD